MAAVTTRTTRSREYCRSWYLLITTHGGLRLVHASSGESVRVPLDQFRYYDPSSLRLTLTSASDGSLVDLHVDALFQTKRVYLSLLKLCAMRDDRKAFRRMMANYRRWMREDEAEREDEEEEEWDDYVARWWRDCRAWISEKESESV